MLNRDLLKKISKVPDDTTGELNKKSNTNHTHNYAGSSSAGGVATQAAKTTGALTIQGNGTSLGTFNGSANKTVNITASNVGAATSDHTHNALVIKTNGTQAASYNGSSDTTVNITPSSIGASASNHTHNYAGSSSAGGVATQAAKTTGALTIQGNGTQLITFNGSSTKTVNITASNIGAATSDHTHTHNTLTINGSDESTPLGTFNNSTNTTITITPSNIGAATGDADGIATQAAKTTGALTIQGNGTSLGTFNGSANKTVNITPSSIGAATSGHTHNYAGSSSAGGVATEAAKTTGTLTIQTNGTQAAVFNGSSSKMVNITASNVGAATSDHIHSTLTVKGNGTNPIGTFNGSANTTITITPSNIGASASGHTHNYAGSSSAGGVATQAAKTTGALTIQGNGTQLITFNGSSTKTVNITPSNIGAATSDHTHTHNTLTINGTDESTPLGTFNNSTNTTITITPTGIGAAIGDADGNANNAKKTTGTLTIQGNGTNINTFNGSANKTVNITPSNIGAATSDHTHNTLTVKGSGTNPIGTFNGSANTTITITPSNIGASASGHTHNYAGSSSAGGAATSANKVNKTLTIQTNGTQAAVFDGSSAKTVNITPSNIGAATSDHTHTHNTLTVKGNGTDPIGTFNNSTNTTITITPSNIGAATGDADGIATQAAKTTGTLTIQGNGTSLGAFNGSANKSINITATGIGAATGDTNGVATQAAKTTGTLTIKDSDSNSIGEFNGSANKTIYITPENIGAAKSVDDNYLVALEAAKTTGILTVKGNGTSLGTFDGSANKSINITASNVGAATSNHTHNYAGSSSAGGVATEAAKTTNSLTIQGNGTSLGVFNGSSAKTVNITPDNIGASASGHTHNYAGSSSAGGVATQAAKTTGALTIQGNGTSLGTFNGSANKTVNITPSNIGAVTPDNLNRRVATVSVLDHNVVNDGTTDNTAAIQNLINSGYKNLYFPDGTYLFNISIATSNVNIIGQSKIGTIFTPYADEKPVIELNSTNGNITNNNFSNFTIYNNTSFTTTEAITLTGSNENDRHTFRDILIDNGFFNSISLLGRSIWNIFENIWINGSANAGLYAAGGDAKNLNTFNNVTVKNGKKYGGYFNVSKGGTDPDHTYKSFSFINCNFEGNCSDATVKNQAALYLYNIDNFSFINCYIENNDNSTSLSYGILSSCKFTRGLTIEGCLIWGHDYGIFINSIVMSGSIESNRLANNTQDIVIGSSSYAGANEQSNMFVGGNTLSKPLLRRKDVNSNAFIASTNPFSVPYRHANNSATPDVKNCNLVMAWTTEDVTDFLNGIDGQVLTYRFYGAADDATKTIKNNDNIKTMDGQDVVLSNNETVSFVRYNDQWVETNRNKNDLGNIATILTEINGE